MIPGLRLRWSRHLHLHLHRLLLHRLHGRQVARAAKPQPGALYPGAVPNGGRSRAGPVPELLLLLLLLQYLCLLLLHLLLLLRLPPRPLQFLLLLQLH